MINSPGSENRNTYPKLSVIMTVRNAVTTIANALDSIIAQHYPNIELIICDGLSDDGTQTIINNYSHIITLFKSEPDAGPSHGFNKAISLATGDYIGVLNADDRYEPGALWAVADEIIKQPAAEIVTFGMLYREYNKGHEVITGYYADERQLSLTLDSVLIENQTFLLSRFVKRSLYTEIGLLNLDKSLWYYSGDREWMTRLAIRGCTNVIIPKALYGFTYHKKSVSNNPGRYDRIIEEHILIAAMLLGKGNLSETQKTIVKVWRERQLVFGFWHALFSGKFGKAKSFAQQGLSLGNWKFILLLFYLLVKKALKRIGLKISGAIDRGVLSKSAGKNSKPQPA
jgi:glycosyltransferase involved in cell wall biosynthesis